MEIREKAREGGRDAGREKGKGRGWEEREEAREDGWTGDETRCILNSEDDAGAAVHDPLPLVTREVLLPLSFSLSTSDARQRLLLSICNFI